ncbi:MAG: hypothetical protein AB7E60_02930 [Sphingobium sp.]
MTESRQYIACKFRITDARSYTYHNDGEPLAVGDFAKVEDRDGDGWKRVEVVAIGDEAPSFPTKPTLGKIEPEADGNTLNDFDDHDLQTHLEN